VSQNVTMFPVQVNILNPEHLLKPGMNTEVEIHVGQRQGALAIPNAALRTTRDVGSAASVLGLDSLAVQRQLAADATDAPRAGGDTASADPSKLHAAELRKPGATFTTRSGGVITRPLAAPPPGGGDGGSYIVFALRGGKIVPVPIQTGLTDLDYIEVRTGLTEQDTVLVLSGTGTR